jgi:hypothetical protein
LIDSRKQVSLGVCLGRIFLLYECSLSQDDFGYFLGDRYLVPKNLSFLSYVEYSSSNTIAKKEPMEGADQ